jgi:hypothetical protein
MPYASILAQKNKKMNQCLRKAIFQQRVSVFRCPFLDAGKSDPETCSMEPETTITELAYGLRVPCVGILITIKNFS